MSFSSLRVLGRARTFLVLLVALGLSGCGASGTVSGKVSYNGKNLKGGTVTFISSQGKASASTNINEDGTYTIDNVPAGDVKVCVDTSMLNPAGKSTHHYSAPPGQKPPEGLEDSTDTSKRYVEIPKDYAFQEKTTLTLTVKGGKQTHDIELK